MSPRSPMIAAARRTASFPAARRSLLLFLLGGASLPLAGCPLLSAGGGGGGGPEMPGLTLQQVALTAAPTEVAVASWACHDQLTDVLGRALCTGLFGRAPRIDDLRFAFDLIFEVDNPNDFPIPLVEMLLELNVFSGRVQKNLGALCVTFCDPEAGENCNLHAADGCRTDQFPEGGTAGLEIDPVAVVEGLIDLATDDPGEEDEEANQWIRMLPAGGSTQVTIRIEIGALAMLDIIQQALFDSIDWSDLAQGQVPDVKIPYSVRGYLWFDIGRIGRVWLAFGPFGDDWDLLARR